MGPCTTSNKYTNTYSSYCLSRIHSSCPSLRLNQQPWLQRSPVSFVRVHTSPVQHSPASQEQHTTPLPNTLSSLTPHRMPPRPSPSPRRCCSASNCPSRGWNKSTTTPNA